MCNTSVKMNMCFWKDNVAKNLRFEFGESIDV